LTKLPALHWAVNRLLQPEDAMTVTPEQSRAARALLNWSRSDLAKAAGVGQSTIAKFERRERTPHASNLAAIRAALETAGIVFIEGDDTMGAGLRLRDPEGQ
jgi:transcriptional regulator with XRE-family HTH domain